MGNGPAMILMGPTKDARARFVSKLKQLLQLINQKVYQKAGIRRAIKAN